MKLTACAFAVLASLAFSGCQNPEGGATGATNTAGTGSSGASKSAPFATELSVKGGSSAMGTFHSPSVEVMESSPVQFALLLQYQAPSGGYKLHVEDLAVDAARARIVAKLRAEPPKGAGIAMMSDVPVRLALGAVRQGEYKLEILLRQKVGEAHKTAQSLGLVAK